MASTREEVRKAVSVGTFRALMMKDGIERSAEAAETLLKDLGPGLDEADPTWEETKALERLTVALVRVQGALGNITRALAVVELLDYVQGDAAVSVRAVVKGTDVPLAGARVAVPA